MVGGKISMSEAKLQQALIDEAIEKFKYSVILDLQKYMCSPEEEGSDIKCKLRNNHFRKAIEIVKGSEKA